MKINICIGRTVYVSLIPNKLPLPEYMIMTCALIRCTLLKATAEAEKTTRQHDMIKVMYSIFQSGFVVKKLWKVISSFLVLIVRELLEKISEKNIMIRLDLFYLVSKDWSDGSFRRCRFSCSFQMVFLR